MSDSDLGIGESGSGDAQAKAWLREELALLKLGLTSVTFRELSPENIIALAAQAGMDAIEWGGDIHVPPGNLHRAGEVAAMTVKAGLAVSSYGSYYRLGEDEDGSGRFAGVLRTAEALAAPSIRVWAGTRGTAAADDAWWELMAADAARIAGLAAASGIRVDFEYHGGTLTDNAAGAIRLMEQADHPNLGLYWQPADNQDVQQAVQDLCLLAPYLHNLHVFHWVGSQRCPLEEGRAAWEQYLAAATNAPGLGYALLEFVEGDDPGAFAADARVLRTLGRPG